MSKRLYQQIETLWDYLQLHQQPDVADLILVLGSNDVRVAEHAAKLYHQGLAPYVLFSGGFGRFTQGVFNHSEAETFAAIAKDAGVPEHAILLETQSTNSGENLHFSHQLLVQQTRPAKRILLVQKPYMERRAYATFMQQWPESVESVQVTSPAGSFFDYLTSELTSDFVLNAMLGDFERIRDYPALGFQITQPIPEPVMQAYQALLPLKVNLEMS
ncbi:YdcF family protein [Vibrio cholerae]|uniref:YdcF family protein n=1 Tax=Vibrio paracholerae TaxID=650003 RepID=UPI000E5B9DA9|nr:YdcF family protein [Vibrio paracholerae]EGQ8475039.1 YdcF family protein [Vibrio cholerae]EHD2279958.1 YdcF family protein [Vibrio cholerae]EJL6485570.1 YdcF family protein [Vibrio cholerae]EJL6584887.1 YdcF family protein [Vibrio cholerae]EJL6889620.1 YdcF family protein [Vibrio cholerae]